jgi:SAM-dependent methyltransferase
MPELYCRLCGSNRLIERLTFENVPRSIQRLLKREQLDEDSSLTLHVYQCEDCNMVQLCDMLESDYYDDYMMTVSHSPQMNEYQRSQAFKFVSQYDLVGKRVIEVGCGDGNYMEHLREAGSLVYGIEPSYTFRKMAAERGFKVYEGYANRQSMIPGVPYDAFVTRQVLEHVPNPNDLLQGIRHALVSRGVGLVEVPSLEQTLERERFYDFFPDHLNYFSEHTLRHALERNGFEVVETSRGMNGEYNIAIVRKAEDSDVPSLQKSLDTIASDLHNFLEKCAAEHKRVAVWGAGGKGLTLMAITGIKNVAYVIDSDPHKEGLFTPVSHLPIVAPEKLLSDPVDAIIVTA